MHTKILSGKRKEKRSLWETKRKWKDINKIDKRNYIRMWIGFI
jgi:hypothetical protein